MYTCIPNCKKMQKTQHISHRAVPCAFCFCIDGLVYFHCFYRCYDIRLCVHITRNCSSLHLFCCAFFLYSIWIHLLARFHQFSSPIITFIVVVIFSVLPYLFPMILYVPVFSTHISHFLREKKNASVFEFAVHIQFSSLFAEIVGRDSSTLQHPIK